ncbi:MAG: InlB B-repeat-containing protein [Firmicutes bacterium]|nr:InlB B-repeat-containing protein [Bacillota bacterium]
MKNRQKLILVMLVAVAIMLAPISTAYADTESGEMTATNQTYKAVGEGQRIDSFKLDGKFNYKSLGNDSGKPTFTLNASSIQNIVKNKLLPQWSEVATSIFRDQASQLVDLYGYQNNGDCMSPAGFDAYFDRTRSGNEKYKDENWSCYSLRDKLIQTYPSRAGEQNWDQFVVSGVKQISKLSDARKMMGQAIYDIQKSSPVTVDEILDVDENGEERLSGLDDDTATTGFTNIVTSINCKGASKEYDYVSFGIAFYDFEPVPVAAKNLEYVSCGANAETTEKGTNSSDITNNQQQDIMHSALLGDSVTETTSTTLSGLASFNMQQNIGANIGMSTTETSSSSSFWDDETFGMGSSTDSESTSLSLGMDWGAAWEMGGAMGAEMGHSTSKEVSKAVETTISLPPHTATNTTQTTTTTTFTHSYQQPVILSYKVAIFAISGDVSMAGVGGINPSIYDKQSLVIKFDTKDETDTSYGCAATDDLYSRVVTNRQVKNYDSSGERTFESHSTGSGFTKSNGINWDDVETYINRYDFNLNNIASTNYFYETPGKVTVEQDKTSSNVGELYPLYNLASVRTPKTNYVLYTNNTLNSDSFPLEGYNRFNVAFYGFNPDWGEWNRCNENGEIINNGYLTDEDPVELKGNELVPKEGTTGGTIYMTWKFKEGTKAKTGEQLSGQVFADSDIETPIVKIQVMNIGLDDPKVNAEGSYKGFYKTPINLHNEFTYEVTDGDDKILETQVYWESREPESSGIQVNSGTGDVKFTKPGTYKVRPYVINNNNKKVYSDWLKVTATEHDLMHYDKKDPTCADDGWKEHYRCTECGKYFSDAEGKNEVQEEDILIDATGHDWGEWTTTKEPSGNEAGEQERVCKTDESHVDKRDLYSVQFNVNGRGTAPEKQNVPAGASVKVPQDPTATGYTFDGWFTDKACTEAYDFGATVNDNMVLYAKWTANKYTAAAMAIDLITGEYFVDENGEEQTEVKVAPTANGSIKNRRRRGSERRRRSRRRRLHVQLQGSRIRKTRYLDCDTSERIWPEGYRGNSGQIGFVGRRNLRTEQDR